MGPRVTSWVLLVAAGVLLGIGSFTSSWFERETTGVERVGLRSVSLCRVDECLVLGHEPAAAHQQTTRTELVAWSGRIGYGVGLATALAAFVCALILAVRRTRHGAIVVLGLTIVAAGSASTFILASTYELEQLGWSARTYLGGCGVAFLGAVLALLKVPLVPWEARFPKRR